MSKISKILILVLLIGGVVTFGLFTRRSFSEGGPFQIFQSAAQKAKPLAVEEKILPKITDKDKNKIFDNLEEIIKGRPDEASFDTILLFEENLSESLFEKTRGRVGNFSIKYQYPSISGIATTLTKGQIIALSKIPFVKQIEEDAIVVPFLDKATYWFGVQKARTDFGLDGNKDGLVTYSKDDIVIAVIDTGIDPNHVDLDGGKIIGWKDFATGQANPYDEVPGCGGHGTHVSSIIAGEGQGNALYKGVAPGAALVGVKVLSLRNVQGQIRCTAATSEIVSGVQWMIDNKATYGIDIGNMSLGTSGCSDGTDSLSSIVNSAVDAGIVMAVSAGNEGPGPCTIGSPAAADKAITVGAMADVTPGASLTNACGDNDLPNAGFYLACFSSRGLTADNRIKPDIASPGTFIRAAAAGTTNGYKDLTGTSMSSPFTAGVAALMLDANPVLTPLQIKQKIGDSALNWGPAGIDVDYGSGRLQGYEAVKSAGSFIGTGPSVPSHSFTSDSLGGSNTQDFWNINVTDASLPLAITMIMPNWTRFNNPDFDMELRDPSGTVIASSISATRQETIGVLPATTGTYQLRVYIFRGSGPYFFDVSFGATAVSIVLTTDGTTPFGILALGTVKDTTPSGTNDVQTVRVDIGPANLNVRSTVFSDGTNSWTLGTTNGDNQVVWEYSKEGTTWNKFLVANNLYPLAVGVSQTGTQNIYFRLTMPTATVSTVQYSSVITVVATAP